MKIFRYVPPDRINLVESEIIAFTPPSNFNDPFDLRPVIKPITSRAYLKQQMKAVDPTLSKALQSLSRKAKRSALNKARKIALADYRINAQAHADRMQPELEAKIKGRWGVLCLSTTKDSLLMWAHYTANHQGFVIEYDIDDHSFRALGQVERVMYSAERPLLDVINITSDIYLRKSEEWSYEQEYRIIRPLMMCRSEKHLNHDLFVCPLEHSALKAIYLGVRASQELKQSTFELRKRSGSLFKVYQSSLHSRCFQLIFSEVP
jgi:hypothetical protein